MAYRIANHEEVWAKAKTHQVSRLRGNWYAVVSGTSGKTYEVDLSTMRCTCDRDYWIGHRNGYVNGCSHVQAALAASDPAYRLTPREADASTAHLHRREVRGLDGDNVKFTARRVTEPTPVPEMTLDELNDFLFG